MTIILPWFKLYSFLSRSSNWVLCGTLFLFIITNSLWGEVGGRYYCSYFKVGETEAQRMTSINTTAFICRWRLNSGSNIFINLKKLNQLPKAMWSFLRDCPLSLQENSELSPALEARKEKSRLASSTAGCAEFVSSFSTSHWTRPWFWSRFVSWHLLFAPAQFEH